MPDGRTNNGGARSGSGRKSFRDKYDEQVNRAEQIYADAQEAAARRILELAVSSVRVEQESVAAGTLFVDAPLTYANGEPMIGPGGKAVMGKVLAFPDLDPQAMVVIKRKEITLPPDREANIYITDRIQGKPITAIEADLAGSLTIETKHDLSALTPEELNNLERITSKTAIASNTD